jgi:molecular chaperone Hsp33
MDQIIRAITNDGFIKASVINSREVVATAQQLHNLGKVASAALGRTLTASLILSNDMKNEEDRVSIQIRSEGEIGNIIAESNGKNEVKGFVSNSSVTMPKRADGKIDVGGALGHKGTLTIIKDIGLKEPYIGTVELISGEIAEDISYYYMQSEQIPTVLGLGVLVAQDLTILSAGGYMIQLLPDAPDDIIDKVEANVKKLPQSISEHFSSGKNENDLLDLLLDGFAYHIISSKPVSYKCDCGRYKVETALMSLGKDELLKIQKDEEQAEVTCHYCNKKYSFNKEDLQVLVNVIDKMKEISSK